jgi:DNA-binding transcriptional regulator YdaS (Cro superfamily)
MEKVIKFFGGRSNMARIFGVERAAISQWANGSLPPARAIEIEERSFGKFKAVDLVGNKKG